MNSQVKVKTYPLLGIIIIGLSFIVGIITTIAFGSNFFPATSTEFIVDLSFIFLMGSGLAFILGTIPKFFTTLLCLYIIFSIFSFLSGM